MTSIRERDLVRLTSTTAPEAPQTIEGRVVSIEFGWQMIRVFLDTEPRGVWLDEYDETHIVERDGRRLPEKPGVYRFSDDVHTIVAQRADDGTWWPWPYSFSGWRESELLGFAHWATVEGVDLDVPEIRDPEKVALIGDLADDLRAIIGGTADVGAWARQLVLERGWTR